MKAIQSTGKIDNEGRLSLDHPLPGILPRAVRVIILYHFSKGVAYLRKN